MSSGHAEGKKEGLSIPYRPTSAIYWDHSVGLRKGILQLVQRGLQLGSLEEVEVKITWWEMGVLIRKMQRGSTQVLPFKNIVTYMLILPWKQECFDPCVTKVYVNSRRFTLVTVKKEFINLSHFIHLFFICSSIPTEETATFKDVYFKLVLWIEKLFHLFLPCIGYNILQMAAFIRIPLQTIYWLYAFRNGPHSPLL